MPIKRQIILTTFKSPFELFAMICLDFELKYRLLTKIEFNQKILIIKKIIFLLESVNKAGFVKKKKHEKISQIFANYFSILKGIYTCWV